MGRHGFIHDKLDIKFLVLYLMARVKTPIDLAVLTDLVLSVDDVDYFDFAASTAELVETEHLTLQEGFYEITEKGRKNSAICESSLAFSVRLKSDKNLARINTTLRRNAQVRTEILPRDEDDTGFTLRLILDDEHGNLLTIELLTASIPQAKEMAARFRAYPESFYHGVLDVLLTTGNKIEEPEDFNP